MGLEFVVCDDKNKNYCEGKSQPRICNVLTGVICEHKNSLDFSRCAPYINKNYCEFKSQPRIRFASSRSTLAFQ